MENENDKVLLHAAEDDPWQTAYIVKRPVHPDTWYEIVLAKEEVPTEQQLLAMKRNGGGPSFKVRRSAFYGQQQQQQGNNKASLQETSEASLPSCCCGKVAGHGCGSNKDAKYVQQQTPQDIRVAQTVYPELVLAAFDIQNQSMEIDTETNADVGTALLALLHLKKATSTT